ncbi:MAG: SpvB/TcaC N-terminal domain-containing protein [Nitrospirota bacterium]
MQDDGRGRDGSQGDGKNAGSAAPSIALPKGGGALRGIGEKFAANPVTGTASLVVPVFTSPGRANFNPQLTLSYDSGSGNGPFGFGWSLSVPSVARKTDKGIPRYLDAEEPDVFILSGAEDLVPVLDRNAAGNWETLTVSLRIIGGVTYAIERYRPRIEGLFARIERWTSRSDRSDSFWRTISKDNVTTWYGRSPESRIADPADPARIFSWLICESHDDKGNAIVYGYKGENAEGVFEDAEGNPVVLVNERNRERRANRYLKRIRYGNRAPYFPELTAGAPLPAPPAAADPDGSREWHFEVVFDYGEHHAAAPHSGDSAGQGNSTRWLARPDPFSTYRSGFEVRTSRLCRRVLMFHHFKDEPGVGDNCLVRSTDFTYDFGQEALDAATPGYTFLRSAVQSGYRRDQDGYLKRSLPPLEFDYSRARVQDEIRDVDAESLENLPAGVDGSAVQWTDLHGEGIPGLLIEQAGAWYYKRNLSLISTRPVELAPLEPVTVKPTLSLGSGQAQFMDLAGDGRPDLVVLDGPLSGLFEHDEQDGWLPFRPFTSRLNRDTRDPNLRFIDLDGDGRPDVLITEEAAFVWHASLGEGGFGPARTVAQALDEEKGPRLVFAEEAQSVYLADMSGDGLTDLVRIRNGEVCYWPNLGHCRFGPKISMDNAPLFDHPDRFSPQRLRLADIDGTGAIDIIYLHSDGVRLYFNQSGNGWSAARPLKAFPAVNSVVSIAATDLLGNGTACLVWSSPLPGDNRQQMRYIDLMGGQKPHLLTLVRNNLGAETRIRYASSATFYLQDRRDGKDWVTRLPFPVHVVERVETWDYVSRNRFVTRYAYHHGYFDGEEREFRGFGMVEQWDTEELAALGGAFPPGDNDSAEGYLPPVYTKTWFHTGLHAGRGRVSRYFAGLLDGSDVGEYYPWRRSGDDASDRLAKELLLDDTVLPRSLPPEEEREACRALKGCLLRQEVYALDGTEKQDHPYTVIEQNFAVRRLQPRGRNRHAVFFTHARERLSCRYERIPDDPRVSHEVTLEVDPTYGSVLKTLAVGYGRAKGKSPLRGADKERQEQTLITYTESDLTNAVDRPVTDPGYDPDNYRVPLQYDVRTYEVTGISPAGGARLFSFDELVKDDYAVLRTLPEAPYQQAVDHAARRKRLLRRVRALFRRNDLTDLLGQGVLESRALPGETYVLVFPKGLLDQVLVRGGQKLLPADPAGILAGGGADRGGYVDLDGDGSWWRPSGRLFYSPLINHTPAQERAFARQHFFLSRRYRDAWQAETIVSYDRYDLLLLETRDPLGNRITAGERGSDPLQPLKQQGIDYRVLQPGLLMDRNGNCTRVAFDALGMVVGTAIMGKPLPAPVEGDSLEGFAADLSRAEIEGLLDAPDPRTPAPALLGKATMRFIYDLDRFYLSRRAHPGDPAQWRPACAATLTRETHAALPLPPQGIRIQIAFSYSDGFGREIQKKIQAAPGPLPGGGPVVSPRWIGSGWTIFNNKGNPVRQYEPSFSGTHAFEFGLQAGVSSVLFYDPAGRVVATVHPNHTYEKIVLDPWRQVTCDANDTVAARGIQSGDPRTDPDIGGYVAEFFRTQPAQWKTWYQERITGAMGAEEQSAAAKAALHAGTPLTAHFDALGRLFLTLAHNGFKPDGSAVLHAGRISLDIEGKKRAVFDAGGRLVMSYGYDMLGRLLHQSAMDSGERWTLHDSADRPLRSWDSGGHTIRIDYDLLRRPLRTFVTGADPDDPGRTFLAERIVYGEQHPEAEQRNLRGRACLYLDQAGMVVNEAHDLKGNLARVTRRLARGYRKALDWSGVDATLPADGSEALDPAGLEAAAALLVMAESFGSMTSYDALNRPVQLVPPRSSLPGAKCTVVQPFYNEAGLLQHVRVWLDCPATPVALLDPAAEPTSPVGVGAIEYNAKGQRLLIRYDNGAVTRYTYDPATFRLVRLYTRRGAAFTKDCDNPQPPPATMPSPEEPPGAPCGLQNLRYTYDPAGNITHIHDDARQTVYFNGQVVPPHSDYTYDALYRLVRAGGREHIGQVGQPETTWNDAFRSRQAHPQDGQAMRNYTEQYEYDDDGNILKLIHQAADRNWTRTYAYDETSQTEPAKKNNRLTSASVGITTPSIERYRYDARGNTIRMPHLAGHPDPAAANMHWDYKSQLRRTDLGGGGTAYYTYDASGQRVRKVREKAPGLIEERLYLGGVEFFRRHGGAIGSDTAVFERETLHITDGSQRIALVETRTLDKAHADPGPARLIRYQLGNHLGSALLELDHQAAIVSYEEYTPFGSTSYQAVRSQTETPKRYRFAGKERDDETGFSYHGARYYAPWLGRWISPDPAGLKDGSNLYAATRNNPVRLVDPTGMAGEETNVVKPVVLEALKTKGVPYATEVMFDVVSKSGKVITSGRFDVFFLDPRTGSPVIPELKGVDLGALTQNQEIYKPMLESSEGATIRITGSKAAGLGVSKGVTLVVSGENYVVVGMENLTDFREALDQVAGGKIKHTFLDKSGKVHMFKTTEEFEQFLKKTGRTKPTPPGGPKGFVTLEGLGIMLGVATALTQYVRGGQEIAEGKTAEGAISTAEGSTTLFMTFAPYAKGVTAATGTGAGALTAAAGLAAAGSIMLAAETGRAAVRGEETPLEVADKFYGTQFSDVYAWQKRSTTARVAFGVLSLGLSEAWYALNKSVEQ